MPPKADETLDLTSTAGEALWLALRRLSGVELGAFISAFPQVDLAWVEARIAGQLRRGNLEFDAERGVLRVAPGRWLWHDSIALDLVASPSESR